VIHQVVLCCNISEVMIEVDMRGFTPVCQAKIEDPVQLPSAVLELLVLLGLWVKVVLEVRAQRVIACTVAVGISLNIRLDGECPEILANHIQARDTPCLETVVLVTPNQSGEQFLPRLIHFCP
jgi:hypothetical protein